MFGNQIKGGLNKEFVLLGLIFESILRVLGVRPSDHVKETAAFGEKTPGFSANSLRVS